MSSLFGEIKNVKVLKNSLCFIMGYLVAMETYVTLFWTMYIFAKYEWIWIYFLKLSFHIYTFDINNINLHIHINMEVRIWGTNVAEAVFPLAPIMSSTSIQWLSSHTGTWWSVVVWWWGGGGGVDTSTWHALVRPSWHTKYRNVEAQMDMFQLV